MSVRNSLEKGAKKGAISAKQQTFIAAYIEHGTIAEACKVIGINEKTAQRWLSLPVVQAYYHGALDELWEQAMATLQANAQKAVNTIVEVMNEKMQPTPRLKAATEMLDRLAASRAKREAQLATTASGFDPDLLQFLTNEQLGELARLRLEMDAILEAARVVKIEKEGGNITPIRRVL